MSVRKSDGFTIIELMIATVVFSVVLLVMTTAIIQIGRIYTKGISGAKTQEAARNLLNDIAQQFQYGSSSWSQTPADGDPNVVALCVGSRQYSYKLNQQRAGVVHGVVARQMGNCLGEKPQDISGSVPIDGSELLGENMRLSNLAITRVGAEDDGVYRITIRVVYGDDDLLCSPTKDNCSADGVVIDVADRDVQCKNVRSGTEFCSASELTTVVERRVGA
jgi:prepilin-type N-terminal cleavage/methylation domain-containing protein